MPVQDVFSRRHHFTTVSRRRMYRHNVSDLEVLTFDDALGSSDFGAQHRMVDWLIAPAGHDPTGDERLDAVADQQIVLEAHEEA
jgi:hypothetical protein